MLDKAMVVGDDEAHESVEGFKEKKPLLKRCGNHQKFRRVWTLTKPSGAKEKFHWVPGLNGAMKKMRKLERKLERLNKTAEAGRERVKAIWAKRQARDAAIVIPEYTGPTLAQERLIRSADVVERKIKSLAKIYMGVGA